MITAFALILAVLTIFLAGACAHLAFSEEVEGFWLISLAMLALGSFGFYALIVGK